MIDLASMSRKELRDHMLRTLDNTAPPPPLDKDEALKLWFKVSKEQLINTIALMEHCPIQALVIGPLYALYGFLVIEEEIEQRNKSVKSN